MQTERLLLREFAREDWREVLAYQQDPRYLRFYRWSSRTAADVRSFIAMFVRWQRERPRTKHQLAIVLRQNDRLIGNCGIRKATAEAWEAELGYEIDPRHWGRGYATEAARRMLGFAFDNLELHRVWASCIAENVASARVLEKLGMRREGHLRQNQWLKGHWHDSYVYAILEQEWRAQPGGR